MWSDALSVFELSELFWIQRTALHELCRQWMASARATAQTEGQASTHSHSSQAQPNSATAAVLSSAQTVCERCGSVSAWHARARANLGLRLCASMEAAHEWIVRAMAHAALVLGRQSRV